MDTFPVIYNQLNMFKVPQKEQDMSQTLMTSGCSLQSWSSAHHDASTFFAVFEPTFHACSKPPPPQQQGGVGGTRVLAHSITIYFRVLRVPGPSSSAYLLSWELPRVIGLELLLWGRQDTRKTGMIKSFLLGLRRKSLWNHPKTSVRCWNVAIFRFNSNVNWKECLDLLVSEHLSKNDENLTSPKISPKWWNLKKWSIIDPSDGKDWIPRKITSAWSL